MPMGHELAFERPEAAFAAGVGPTVTLPAHARRDAVVAEQTLVTLDGGGVAALLVVPEPGRWSRLGRREGGGPPGRSAAGGRVRGNGRGWTEGGGGVVVGLVWLLQPARVATRMRPSPRMTVFVRMVFRAVETGGATWALREPANAVDWGLFRSFP